MTQHVLAQPPQAGLSRRTWVMIILVACLTALAIWLVPDEQPAMVDLPPVANGADTVAPAIGDTVATSAEVDQPVATEAASPTVSAANTVDAPLDQRPAPVTPSPTSETKTALPAGAAARGFIATRPAPDAAAALAEADRQRQAGHVLDAYLLTFYAARQGDDQAALMLAHQADPAFGQTDPGPLAAADIPQALRWYDQAAAAGNPAAIADRQQLRNRIEQAAAEGDEDARRLTLQWQ